MHEEAPINTRLYFSAFQGFSMSVFSQKYSSLASQANLIVISIQTRPRIDSPSIEGPSTESKSQLLKCVGGGGKYIKNKGTTD